MEFKRVVVTGLGALTPVGNSAPDTWRSLLEGKSGAAPITLFDASKFQTRFACEVKNFQPEEHFDRKEARRYDRYTQFALVAAKEALQDSRLDLDSMDKDTAGVIISAGIGGLRTFEEEVMLYDPERGPRFNPFFIPKMISDIAAGLVSITYGFHGPNYSTASACASSTNAIIDAAIMIRLGKAEVMVAGGSEAAVTAAGIGGFNAMKALSTRNDEPQKASRPFSKSRDGFVLAEGCAILILEELEHAKARGAHIYAELGGFGLSADAYHLTASHPEGLGAKLVMQRVLEDANLRPEDIDYINVHGTSTPVGDASEAKAILSVFGDSAYKLNISSTKSMTGHLLGGAGGIESVFTVLALKNQVSPPTINIFNQDPECDLDYCANVAREMPIRYAMKNSFGFGGTNGSLIFGQV